MGRVVLLALVVVISLAGCSGDVLRDLANPGEFVMYTWAGITPPYMLAQVNSGDTIQWNSTGETKEFTIKNLSEQGVLRLWGSPRVSFSGSIAANLSVVELPAGTVDPGGETTLTIKFSSGSSLTGTMIIETNDPDHDTFVVTMRSI